MLDTNNSAETTQDTLILTSAGIVLPTYTARELEQIAVGNLGVLHTASYSDTITEPNAIFSLDGGWNAKWFKVTNGYVLKLISNDRDKRFLLDKGIIRHFMAAGFSKFVSVALLKSRIKYKIELVWNLKAIMENTSYRQAFQSHPFYIVSDTVDTSQHKYENKFRKPREAWFERWGEIFEKGLLSITLKQECEMVRMIKAVENAEVLFKKQEELKASKAAEETKPVKKYHNNKFNKSKVVKPSRTFEEGEDSFLNSI